jgi:MraZ protein
LNFRGRYEHSLDAKHRLTVPARYREVLSNGVVLALSPETAPGAPRSIAIWIADDYDAHVSASLASLNPISPEAAKLRRLLNNNAHDTELDSAYRVMIPTKWLDFAELGKEVVVTGSGNCLEVWDRAKYDAYNSAALSEYPELAASIGHSA